MSIMKLPFAVAFVLFSTNLPLIFGKLEKDSIMHSSSLHKGIQRLVQSSTSCCCDNNDDNGDDNTADDTSDDSSDDTSDDTSDDSSDDTGDDTGDDNNFTPTPTSEPTLTPSSQPSFTLSSRPSFTLSSQPSRPRADVIADAVTSVYTALAVTASLWTDTNYCNWDGTVCHDDGLEIKGIDFYEDVLTGSLATEIGILTGMTYLNLDYSRTVQGTLPTELGLLVAVTGISARGNDLTGPIPTELDQLQLLDNLQLAENALTGTAPSYICNDIGNVEVDAGLCP